MKLLTEIIQQNLVINKALRCDGKPQCSKPPVLHQIIEKIIMSSIHVMLYVSIQAIFEQVFAWLT